MNGDNPAPDYRPGTAQCCPNARRSREKLRLGQLGLAPTHVPTLSALPATLDRGKVAFGSWHLGNPGSGGTKMQLCRNAKGTIGFMLAMVVGQIWSAVSPVYKPPWEPWPPIVPFMVAYVLPFLNDFYHPIMLGLTGLVVLWVWEDSRAGYVVAFVLAAIATGFGVGVTIFNTMNQEWSGLFTAVTVVVFPAVMALWYSFQGSRARTQHNS